MREAICGPLRPREIPDDLAFRTRNLSANPAAEIIRRAKETPDVIFLAQGESDFPTPAFIIQACEEALRESKTFYGPSLGYPALREELTAYYKRIYNLDIAPNRLCVTPSGAKAMNLALTALLEPGDEVLAVTPIWKNLLSALELAQATIREVPLRSDSGEWALNMDELFDSWTPSTKIILVTTPSNPCGWIMRPSQMQLLMDFARQKGIWIISDEVYGRIVYDAVHAPSFLSVATPEDRLIVINSFSKTWAMTGWRLGWMVVPAALEQALRDIAFYDYMAPPGFAQYGAIEALRSGEEFIIQQLDLWRTNRDLVIEKCAQNSRIALSRPQSTFYSFFRVEGEPDCLAFARRLLEDYKLAVAPGCAFGLAGKGYIRLCFAASRPRLSAALDRLLASLP